MLNLKQISLEKEPEYTHSEFFIKDSQGNRDLDFCHIIEDTVRDVNGDGDLDDEGEGKVYGKTAIPYTKKGQVYHGQVRISPKRKRLFEAGKIPEHRIWIPYLDNVPHFKFIQMHAGTDETDSLGCPIVGFKWNGKNKVWESRKAEEALVKLIKENDKDYKFTLEII